MPTDIFPDIDIPIVTVVWSYAGLSADQMANRIVSNSERGMTTTVNDIEHIESQSLNGVAVIKVFFQPHVNVASGRGPDHRRSARCMLRQLPPGTTPPFIIQYNASSVPVLQLGLSGAGMSEQQLFDTGQNTIRTQLATVEGAQTPYPYGGKQRQIQVDHRSGRAAGQRTVAGRRGERHQRAKPDRAFGHHEDRSLRVRDRDQLGAQRRGCTLNDLPIKNGERRGHLHPRCGPRARRQSAADQHRARGRQARHPDEHHEDRLSLHPGHHRRHPRQAGRDEGPASAATEDRRAQRSVDLRARRHQGRGPRSHHRRMPHRGHDPACSWGAGARR